MGERERGNTDIAGPFGGPGDELLEIDAGDHRRRTKPPGLFLSPLVRSLAS